MTAIRSHHSRLFVEKIAESRRELLESLALGHSRKIYWQIVGRIQGFDDALKLSEEVDFNMSGEEPSVSD